jgi:hypothetical protein
LAPRRPARKRSSRAAAGARKKAAELALRLRLAIEASRDAVALSKVVLEDARQLLDQANRDRS